MHILLPFTVIYDSSLKLMICFRIRIHADLKYHQISIAVYGLQDGKRDGRFL